MLATEGRGEVGELVGGDVLGEEVRSGCDEDEDGLAAAGRRAEQQHRVVKLRPDIRRHKHRRQVGWRHAVEGRVQRHLVEEA